MPKTTPDTLVHRIAHWAKTTPDRPAVHSQREGQWETLTWAQHFAAIRELGKGLLSLGLTPGVGVAIVGANRPEWVQAQFAVQATGGLPVPLYTMSTLSEVGYIVRDAGVRIAFCDGQVQLDRLLAAERAGHMPVLAHILAFDTVASEDARVLSCNQLRAIGRQQDDAGLDARMGDLTPEGTCCLIYTSGTTGEPKGVRMNAAGQLAALDGMIQRHPVFYDRPYRVVSYLPLSHQAEQLVTNVGAIHRGGEVYFCPQISEVKDYLSVARPTLFLAVPRVWEKFEAALRARLAEPTGVAKWLAERALAVELAGFERDLTSGKVTVGFERKMLRKLVLDKIRAGLGLDKLELALSGSAPIDTQTLSFFASLGIPVYEGYGLTETSGIATVTVSGRPNPGSVGPALPGVEIKLADDGEVLIAGAINTAGYHNKPEATAELFSDDGFLRTGDLGALASDGSLSIVGRKKELLITAGAKKVPPVEIESLLNRIPGVGQSVVVGDRMPYLCAVLTLDPEQIPFLRKVAELSNANMAQLAGSSQLKAHLWRLVEQSCNAHLARYKTIKKISILPTEFSVESKELTASMKLRRKVIVEKHAAVIARLFE